MSDPNISNSETDVSSSESWSVIEEPRTSNKSSIESIIVIDENDNCKNDLQEPIAEKTFVNVSHADVADHTPQSSKKKPAKCNKNRKRKTQTPCKSINILGIMACILTISGINILGMLFSNSYDPPVSRKLQNDFVMEMNTNEPKFDKVLNTTSRIMEHWRQSQMPINFSETVNEDFEEDICPLDNVTVKNDNTKPIPNFDAIFVELERINAPLMETIENTNSTSSLQMILSRILRTIRDPHLHVLVSSMVQNICLTKLMLNMWPNKRNSDNLDKDNKNRSKKKTPTLSLKMKRKLVNKRLKRFDKELHEKKMIPNKPEAVAVGHATIKNEDTIKNKNQDSSKQVSEIEKNKTDEKIKISEKSKVPKEKYQHKCARRFQELETKWSIIGHNHRQKIQDIQNKFQNEITLIRENEKEIPRRMEKIKQIRDKYIQRLRSDRERYLTHIRKLKDERQRIMTDICHKKQPLLDFKDASVGNYAVPIPGSYDFKEKLRSLQNNSSSSFIDDNGNKLNASSTPNLSRFDKLLQKVRHSVANVPESMEEKSKIDMIPQELLMTNIGRANTSRMEYRYNLVRKAKKNINEILEQAQNVATNQQIKTTSIPMYEDLIVATTNETIASKSDDAAANSEAELSNGTESSLIENEKSDDTSDPLSEEDDMSNQFKVVIRRKHRKRHMYEAAFEKDANKIMTADMRKWNADRKVKKYREPTSPSKSDPRKSYKEIILHKGIL